MLLGERCGRRVWKDLEERSGSKYNIAEGVERVLEPEDGEESYKLCFLCDMVLAH